MESANTLSHVDRDGNIQMVDVGAKISTERTAEASCLVRMPESLVQTLATNQQRTAKGSIIDTAVIAGIMAAKKTSELIPLCHPLPLAHIGIAITPTPLGFDIRSTVKTNHTTGVEMEALTAASIAALTLYDMCKAMSHDIVIERLQLDSKTGGKQDFQR